MGFCVAWVQAAPDGAMCTVDWKASVPAGGRQCCYRARRVWVAGGGPEPQPRPPVGVDGSFGAGVAPALDVRCHAHGSCAPPDRTRPARAAAAAEEVTRCGSWAPSVYRRCQVTLCVAARAPRWVWPPSPPAGGVPFCSPRSFGTPALCCLSRKDYWERAKCCAACKPPPPHTKGFGCCWAGPRPAAGGPPAKKRPAPRSSWKRK